MRPKSATVRSTTARSAAVSRTSSNLDAEQVGVLLAEVGDRLRLADRTDDTVTSVEQLFGEVTAETAADPVISQMRCAMVILPCWAGAISLTAAVR